MILAAVWLAVAAFAVMCALFVVKSLEADQLVAVTDYLARFTVRVDVIGASYDTEGDLEIVTVVRECWTGKVALYVWFVMINVAHG